MKTHNFSKDSEEWLEYRLGKSGGSGMGRLYPSRLITKEMALAHLTSKGVEVDSKAKAADVIGLLTSEDIGVIKASGDKKDAYYKMVAERISRPITPNDYEDRLNGRKFSMLERGHLLEPEAIKEFERRNGVKVDNPAHECVVWEREDNPDSIISPDAPLGKTRAVEVKCFDSHRMVRAYDEQVYPSECHEQIIKYFVVNPDLEVLHFVMYTDVMPSLSYLQFDIKRQEVEADIAEIKAFEDSILEQASKLAERLAF